MTRGVAALRDRVFRFPPVRALARLVPNGGEDGTSRARPIRRLVVDLRSSWSAAGAILRAGRGRQSRTSARPVEGDRDEPDIGLAQEPSRAASGTRDGGVTGAVRRRLLRRTVPRALAFLHRHEDSSAAGPREDSEQSPTAP